MSEESKMKEQEDFFLAENDRVLNGAPRPTIAQVAWVMSALSESVSREGCSFRRTIYGLMGFGPEAYVPIYEAGGMNVTNAIVEASDRADLMQAGAQAERARILKIAEEWCDEPVVVVTKSDYQKQGNASCACVLLNYLKQRIGAEK